MEEIKLVVKIPKEEYEMIVNSEDCGLHTLTRAIATRAIANGTPLPKGHGRIGDLDALEKDMIGGINAANFVEGYADYTNINNVDDCVDYVRYADAIIEADKEEE